MPTRDDIVRAAFAVGYRVTDGGAVLGTRGQQRVLQERNGRSTRYYEFSVRIDGCSSSVRVHRLAAFQWFGEAALVDGVQVRHLDGNSLNNARSNLALGTQSENMLDRPTEARSEQSRRASAWRRRFTAQEAAEIARACRSGEETQKGLARKLRVSPSVINAIVHGRTYAGAPQ